LFAFLAGEAVEAHDAIAPGATDLATGHRGAVSIGYQLVKVGGFILRDGSNNLAGDLEGHTALFELDWLLNDRMELHLGLPYIKRQWVGRRAHNPTLCQPGQASGCLTVPHPEAEFIDDGLFHGNWQDWSVGLTYHTEADSFQIEPFVQVQVPSHDYAHFGQSATGPNVWRLEIGADVAKQLAFSNLYYRVGYSYELWEKTLGIDPSKNKARVELGYFLSPRWAVRGLAFGQYGKGRYETELPPGDRTSEVWYQHDRFLRHNHAHAGAGAAFTFWEAYSVSLDVITMVWGQSVLRTDYAATLTLSRSF
jgi:hypothetical protein